MILTHEIKILKNDKEAIIKDFKSQKEELL
jgi:hypothetical protein